jgi:hypothetical protein
MKLSYIRFHLYIKGAKDGIFLYDGTESIIMLHFVSNIYIMLTFVRIYMVNFV